MNTEPSEREEASERLKQIRERRDEAKKLSWMDHPPRPTWKDIDFLLSQLDSQAARCGDAEIVARQISDNVNQYPVTSESVYEWQCMIADALASARESTATRMRERCVGVAEEFRQRIQYGDDEGIREAYFGEMVITMESLTLDGEQEQ